ncbi:hypothetical protein [Thioflexithrix psekupsensis]|uniref:DUF4124 domain-containing protein n=1 Tax=Thioflexithrix psekupsensis TaxID=1570016 RepID=A0A251XAM0_9GAMM|nr:hypothetical protein [Thioflexithrix psekupsensis]OUD15358.1 hypothetical protein TPSD3_02170 [Thioflexithrix psekupsensis]
MTLHWRIGLLCGLMMSASPLWAQEIRCWTDEDGMTQCGNSVPPQYSQKEHTQYNDQAVRIKEFERAKTEEELAEERRQSRLALEAEKARELKLAEDQKLLDLFGNEDDIKTTLDARLNNTDLAIERIKTFIFNTEKNLADLRNSLEVESSRHLTEEQKAQIRRDISDVSHRIEKQKEILNAKLREKEDLRREFEGYLTRYREIMADRAATKAKEVQPVEVEEKAQTD